ncbi:unnamed protein product [Dibothriocephalus latus]|uniref:Uncharacterized protein n=1 Tax=Dibothriocephalus latus TaxID=60516 RepID=A0A3P6SY43_DIBLA|nr:unnamed protein product [Dibothriocephalus latus]
MDDFYGDGCRLAARENCTKNRGEPQLWFMHKADFREGQHAPRIRPEAKEIVEKNSVHVSTACLAGFADRNGDSNKVQDEVASASHQRLRTAEANTIASKIRNPQEEWFDFEGNQKLQLKPKPPRVGASKIAAEFMRQQNRGSDWFTPINKPISIRGVLRMRSKSSTAADLRASSASNCLAHPSQAASTCMEGENNLPNGALRKNMRRVREEGLEYAERNRNNNLVSARTSPQDDASDDGSPDYAPTAAYGGAVKSVPKVHGEEAREWRNRGIGGSMGQGIFAGTAKIPRPATALRVRPEAMEIRERMVSGNQLARRITQQDGDIPLSPFRRSKMISNEAEAAFLRDRVGRMNELIGKNAKSTTFPYPSKVQARVVNSDAARGIQARSTGAAAQELLTHTDLCEARPVDRNTSADARLTAERNRIGSVGALLGYHDKSVNKPQPSPQIPPNTLRLTNTEARTIAEQQRGGETMRGLMMPG